MESGKLNRRIQIQTQSTTQDSFGGLIQTWTTAYTCWAGMDVMTSQLLYSTAEFISKTITKINLRWTSSFVFTPAQRVLYVDGSSGITHTYQIESVVNDKAANRELTLLCYELGGTE